MSILGTTPAADGLPPGAPRGRDAERILAAELLAELRHLQQTTTDWTARLAGQLVNNVLYVATVAIPASGSVSYQFPVAAGCVQVRTAANPLTVTSDGPVAIPPTTGLGVYIAPANSHPVIALASRECTLYGTAGDVVSVQFFTAAPRPMVS